ncbi:MAG TPA: ATP-binding protein [Candidatus Eremiobacteraeota bacterium]|nr:MAG: AAA-like domain protein [bacterium ADurb.Bin363]HPZ08537.1 ATP-binding protein [Candidatus Eremiobacteraeota bacterium]
MTKKRKRLGAITKGSLVEGLEMKLDSAQSIEEIKAGKFIVIDGEKNQFFSMITDMRLDSTNPEILLNPPDEENGIMREILSGTNTYATVCLKPMLMVDKTTCPEEKPEIRPVKSIPAHFSGVYEAQDEDVSKIFGDEGLGTKYFNIGTPLDMKSPVCLNLERFVERSNGIFGKSGTGKTFLTRLVLSGLVRNSKAVNLIFDMHNEYGWDARKEGGGSAFVKGLKQLFNEKVAIFTLDPDSTRGREVQPDFTVQIPYNQIEVDDVLPLEEVLNLTSTALESSYLIRSRFEKEWLRTLLDQDSRDLSDFAEEIGADAKSIGALHRKLSRLKDFKFLTKKAPQVDAVQKIMEYIEKGKHIVLEFGRQSSLLCYLLVANILTRRIHHRYIKKTENYLCTKNPSDEPKHLVITIEEAHKFLNPCAAKQTIFGIIAREMRKYYVSLLVVDQRPSGIDDEVLSQLGTRITSQLNDEKDIQAVLTGVSNTAGLRAVLASLDSKQQALILGHAVPMPVVIKSRNYDEDFYRDMIKSSYTGKVVDISRVIARW